MAAERAVHRRYRCKLPSLGYGIEPDARFDPRQRLPGELNVTEHRLVVDAATLERRDHDPRFQDRYGTVRVHGGAPSPSFWHSPTMAHRCLDIPYRGESGDES